MQAKCEICLNEMGFHCEDVTGKTFLGIIKTQERILYQNGLPIGQLHQPIEQCPIVIGDQSQKEFWSAYEDYDIRDGKLVALSNYQAHQRYRAERIRVGYP